MRKAKDLANTYNKVLGSIVSGSYFGDRDNLYVFHGRHR